MPRRRAPMFSWSLRPPSDDIECRLCRKTWGGHRCNVDAHTSSSRLVCPRCTIIYGKEQAHFSRLSGTDRVLLRRLGAVIETLQWEITNGNGRWIRHFAGR